SRSMGPDPYLSRALGERRLPTKEGVRRVGIATSCPSGAGASVCALPTKHRSPIAGLAEGPMATPHTPAFGWIGTERRAREAAGLVRTLRPRPADSPMLDLASNDYLGLARHPEVVEGAAEAARRWGGGATGSRLVT